MSVRVEFPHDVLEVPDEGIVLRDGCRLSARIWRPADGRPVPGDGGPGRAPVPGTPEGPVPNGPEGPVPCT